MIQRASISEIARYGGFRGASQFEGSSATSFGPQTWTNFQEPRFWTPIYTPLVGTMEFDANNLPLLTAIGPIVNTSTLYFIGVRSTGRLFPDADGLLEIESSWS